MACQICLLMLYRHRLFFLLPILRFPIWCLFEYYNVYLTLSPNEVFHAYHKMEILGTELLQMEFSLLGHDNHVQSTSVCWEFFIPHHNPTNHVPMLGPKYVFKVLLLSWCMCFQSRYELPSVSHNNMHQEFAQLLLTLKETVFQYH